MNKPEIIYKKEWKYLDATIQGLIVKADFPLLLRPRFGIDPGTVHLGASIIVPSSDWAFLYEVTLRRNDDVVLRMLDVQSILHHLFNTNPMAFSDTPTPPFYSTGRCIIEGASYADRYRQVELAEQRSAIALWFHSNFHAVRIIPPLTILKSVFGSAKLAAWKVWDNLPKNAASSLACCLYAG
jgi:hypothetical protein